MSAKTVLVTGASRGLGLALTDQLLAKGHRVIGAYRKVVTPSLRTLRVRHKDRLMVVQLDVCDQDSIAECSKVCSAEHPAIDVVVNNAGVFPEQTINSGPALESACYRDGELAFRTNALGTLEVTRAFLPALKEASPSIVVGICSGYASISSNSGFPYHYAASKAAQLQYLRSMSQDLLPLQIKVLGVDPGWLSTDMGGANAPRTAAQGASDLIQLFDRVSELSSGSFINHLGVSMQM